LNKQLEEVESKINNLEQNKKELENQLADPKVYQNEKLLKESQSKYDALKKDLDAQQKRWESLAVEIEEKEKLQTVR
jgi:ATP-binding cassette subfamily F protein 3